MRVRLAKDIPYFIITALTAIYALVNFIFHVTGGFMGVHFVEVRAWHILGYWVLWPRPFQMSLEGFIVLFLLSLIFTSVGFLNNFIKSKGRPIFAWIGVFSLCYIVGACLPTL